MVYAGVHHAFEWEIEDGYLVIASRDRNVGELTRQAVSNRFNNAEQATWFAQGQIDTQLEALEAIAAQRRL